MGFQRSQPILGGTVRQQQIEINSYPDSPLLISNAAQYLRKSYWTCDTCSVPPSQQSPPPTRSPAPTEQTSDDSTFNVLQLNANGIGNKLAELEVMLERNKVKVAVIQESTLSPKSKNPCIQNYTTVRKDCTHGQGGGNANLHSQIDNLLQTANVTRGAIRSPPGRIKKKK